ncbi:MAG: hypothetical protein H0U50_02135, partial [Pyrinomonadaceae bacterium]|nr:hypothetical protein [Pyrinomonadaceae bacterium]
MSDLFPAAFRYKIIGRQIFNRFPHLKIKFLQENYEHIRNYNWKQLGGRS